MKTYMLVLTGALVLGAAWQGRCAARTRTATPTKETAVKLNSLTAEEERVILRKGTEAPFSGEYNDHFDTGIYLCRHCNAPLYRADDKFRSSCGWPSFDADIPGAVRREPDADGRRTEILCNRCGGHLGHVFAGEGHTPRNLRHCVNSLSLLFSSDALGPVRRAIFASGCFWGTEYMFRDQPGVLAVTVGYTGGTSDNPTYRQVCSGATGHAEAVEIIYDPTRTTYETLTRHFFETHDPTQVGRQGPDVGSQYRSAIFYLTEEQKTTAENLRNLLTEKGLAVATEITPATRFWNAEDYHQDYYRRKGTSPYCHSYIERF